MVASSAAHAELQRIWRLVQELSAQLKENQIETEHLRRQAQFLQVATHTIARHANVVGYGYRGVRTIRRCVRRCA